MTILFIFLAIVFINVNYFAFLLWEWCHDETVVNSQFSWSDLIIDVGTIDIHELNKLVASFVISGLILFNIK